MLANVYQLALKPGNLPIKELLFALESRGRHKYNPNWRSVFLFPDQAPTNCVLAVIITSKDQKSFTKLADMGAGTIELRRAELEQGENLCDFNICAINLSNNKCLYLHYFGGLKPDTLNKYLIDQHRKIYVNSLKTSIKKGIDEGKITIGFREALKKKLEEKPVEDPLVIPVYHKSSPKKLSQEMTQFTGIYVREDAKSLNQGTDIPVSSNDGLVYKATYLRLEPRRAKTKAQAEQRARSFIGKCIDNSLTGWFRGKHKNKTKCVPFVPDPEVMESIEYDDVINDVPKKMDVTKFPKLWIYGKMVDMAKDRGIFPG